MIGIGENIKRIRIIKNKTLEDVANYLKVSKTAISKYEREEIIPDSTKLIALSNFFDVDISDFLKVYGNFNMEFKNFRKKKSLTGKKLEILKNLIKKEVFNYLEILELGNYKPEEFKFLKDYKCNSLLDAENAAKLFREEICISNLLPITDLTSVLENHGIYIIYIEDKENIFTGFDGLSEFVNNVPVIVILKDEKDGARQRFTLSHELGHLMLKLKNDDNHEKFCHRFASSLLMPKEAIQNEFGYRRDFINFSELEAVKQEYRVSYKAIIYRLKDLGIISEYKFKDYCIKLNKIFKNEDPNPINPEKSYKFKSLVNRLEAEGIISMQKAVEYLGVSVDEYSRENNLD